MSVIRIASRYAKSIIDLAQEKGKLDRVVEDIKYFQAVCKSNPDFYRLLKSPIVNGTKKANIFKAIFDSRFDEITKGFLDITVRKGRESYLPEIADEFMEQYRKLNSITTVKLTTAAKLSDTALAAIKKKLEASSATASNIEITTAINPDLIGGFVIEFEDKLFNSSIAYQLEQLRKEFSKNDKIGKLN
jgi:F-type H+-transporting ATPase subunit delta